MTENTDKTTISTNGTDSGSPDATATETASAGGMKKLIIYAAAGLVLIAVVVFGTLVLIGDEQPTADGATSEDATEELADADANSSDAHAAGTKSEEHSEFDEIDHDEFDLTEEELALGADELSAIEEISASLAYLDTEQETSHQPKSASTSHLSKEDSIAEANWLETETKKLDDREAAVTAREKAIAQTEREVSKKILIIEQAESTRVAQLAKLYDGMDARAVTKLMANLKDETVVSIISRMKQKNASNVLSLFSPQRAARLSQKMITIAEN